MPSSYPYHPFTYHPYHPPHPYHPATHTTLSHTILSHTTHTTHPIHCNVIHPTQSISLPPSPSTQRFRPGATFPPKYACETEMARTGRLPLRRGRLIEPDPIRSIRSIHTSIHIDPHPPREHAARLSSTGQSTPRPAACGVGGGRGEGRNLKGGAIGSPTGQLSTIHAIADNVRNVALNRQNRSQLCLAGAAHTLK